jgi:hypothetical protein
MAGADEGLSIGTNGHSVYWALVTCQQERGWGGFIETPNLKGAIPTAANERLAIGAKGER